jgi:hypothetical protein
VADLPLWLVLVLGAVGAALASVLGAVLWSMVAYLLGIPARRRERRVHAVQDQLRELDFRGKATPIVQRLRYLEQHGEHPSEYPNPWQGFQTEMEQIDERLLQPTRQTLERAGQGYLCDQIAVTGDNLGPGALSVELDRLLGVVEGRQNGDANSVPFRFGRRAAHRE